MQDSELITQISGIMIAGTSSGCGKTTITCAILQILVEKGLSVSAFKCGPDYIDPMFHTKITGRGSNNLDSYLCDSQTVKYLYGESSRGSDISVIEGVMGFYDGCKSEENRTLGSAYEISEILKVPVLLIVNCRGMSLSVLAVIKGFLEFCSNRIAGVILNHVTQNTYESLKTEIEEEFSGRVRVFGYIPALPKELLIDSRHLGLIKADEIEDFNEKMNKLTAIARKSIDIDRIIKCASESELLCYKDIFCKSENDNSEYRCRIGIALDTAFCFYYQANLKLLEKLGAELVYFSPLEDKGISAGISGIYIGGGYPELYKEKLSANTEMRNSLRHALEAGMPCIAECGGFMYLQEQLEGCQMAGVIAGNSVNKGKLQRFGYAEFTAKFDNVLCKENDKIKGHEFHYYDSDNNGNGFRAEKLNGTIWDCIVCNDSLFAGYPHLHFYSNPNAAKRFLDKCRNYQSNC